MLMEKERKEIAEYGRKMSSSGLSKGTSGNISIYDPETGYMAISPSGLGYFDTEPEDVVVMDLKGNIIDGSRKPSSEHGLHTVMYLNKPDARAVVHTHSTFCTTLACLNTPLKAVHYVIGGAGAATVPCAEYATFGTPELAENVARAIGKSKAVLLANHGLVTSGPNLAKAFGLAVNLEFVAEMQWRASCMGTPVVLSDAEMDTVMESFKSYGQPKKTDEKKDGMGY
ncbi:L-fuculose-phosphate aldolase [Clostridium sp. KNHs216]|uniref:L-fuculose-phosphate aldolase n=1 Tax=Clostridium sp. KNHs216 TaxID=1550235 RepID=UPI00114DA68B|nr:L-fuculose-phosphate aldolase [Clostridium sp. KNHs216]TQI68476.1 L-fuculose 1-phosphate aldolase [Clostridium sp. KNHs216]